MIIWHLIKSHNLLCPGECHLLQFLECVGLKLISISLVFVGLIFIQLSFDHDIILSVASWSRVSLGSLDIWYRVVSSTYLYVGTIVLRSLIISKNNSTPSLVPCGTVPQISSLLESISPIFTLCDLSDRKSAVQWSKKRGMSNSCSFLSNIFGFILSKALL